MEMTKDCFCKSKCNGSAVVPKTQNPTIPSPAFKNTFRLKLLLLLLFIINFALFNTGLAATFYVDPLNGNDLAAGSAANPWRTIQKAKSTVNAGDVVNLLPGNYGSVTFGQSGDRYGTSWQAPITYQCSPESAPYSARFTYILFSGPRSFYITVAGLDVENTGANDACIKTLSASNVKIIDCKAHGQSGGRGPSYANIFVKSSSSVWVQDCEVYYGGAWSFAVQLEESDTVSVKGCHVHDIVGSAIRTGGGQNYIIENNIVHDQRVEWNSSVHGSGIAIHSHNTTIRGNIVYNFGNTRPIRFYQSWAGPNGFRNMLVENNLVYKTPDFTGVQWWVEFIDVGENCVFRNNTFLDTVIMVFAQYADGSGLSIHNNVITGGLELDDYNASASGPGRTKWDRVSEGNNIFGGLAAKGCGYVCGYNKFSDTSNSIVGANFNVGGFFASGPAHYPYGNVWPYELKEGSLAIDFGDKDFAPLIDLLGCARDELPDAGCYEYGGTSGPPSDIPPTADAGSDQVITDADNNGYERINLDGSGSDDEDGSIVSYVWTENGQPLAAGVNPTVTLTIGQHVITLTVTDNDQLQGSATVTVTVEPGDGAAPSVISVTPSANMVTILFDEPLDPQSAQDIGNYGIYDDITITAASLSIDGTAVVLTTSDHIRENAYTLMAKDICDLAGNKITDLVVNYIYSPGLVGYWQFDEGQGLATEDYSGSLNNGVLVNGPLWTEYGQLSFDGIDDFVSCGNKTSLNLTGSLTIAASINPITFGQSGWGRIVDKGTASAGYSFFVEQAANSIAYVIYGGLLMRSNPDVIELNTWQHVAVVYDQASANVTFYVNGQQAGVTDYQTAAAACPDCPLVIGIRNYDSNRAFDGLIDNVRVYNRALDPNEIIELFYEDQQFGLYPIGDKEVDEGAKLNFTVTTSNPDIVVSISGHNLPSQPTFAQNVFDWTPGYDDAGTYEVTFTAVQGRIEDFETIAITVNNVNRSPVIEPIGDKVIQANTRLTFTVSASDPDGDSITGSVDNLPAGAAFADNTFDWTPTGEQTGTYTVTFTVTDGDLQDAETITITVESPPVPVEEIIIDNGQQQTSFTGAWLLSGGVDPYGADSVWSRNGATYTWTFLPPASGWYDLSMWWTPYPARCPEIPVRIAHREGTATFYINQQENGNLWNTLGRFFFESGSSYNVTITAGPGENTTCADAVKFKLLDDTPSLVINGTSGFTYIDDAFRNTNQPYYASGASVTGDILRVNLGGIDRNAINGMSGGWRRSFSLTSAANVKLSFRYKLTQTPNYESDEFSDAMLSIDGQTVGSGSADYIARITGNGNNGAIITTGWRQFEVAKYLAAGNHTVLIGAYNNKKAGYNESTELLISNVTIYSP